jgi:hypothetical protein
MSIPQQCLITVEMGEACPVGRKVLTIPLPHYPFPSLPSRVTPPPVSGVELQCQLFSLWSPTPPQQGRYKYNCLHPHRPDVSVLRFRFDV